MSILDGSIANTALPTIARDLHASPAASVWVVNGFQLAVTASLFAFASLGTLHGPARVYRAGVILFILGSSLCALAQNLAVLIVARALQGIGAAAIMAISPALLREVFPRAQLGQALGINALVVAASSAAGPTLGGFILAVAPWQLLFAINVPLGLINIALNRALPRDEPAGGKLDIPSAVLSALSFTLTIWGLDGFAHHESFWTIVLRLVVGIASGVAFVLRQQQLPRPMIAVDLFGIPPFALAAATSFSAFLSQGLAYVALPFYFQEALGRTPLQSGLLLTSWPLAIVVVAPIAGRLSDRFPVAILATLGLTVLTVGYALYALLPAHPSTLQIVLHGILCGVGFGLFNTPNNRELIGNAPREKSASAAGFLAAMRVGGQTVGAAAVAIVFGVLGGALTAGTPAHDVVARATPAALWVACACSLIATIASGLRLFVPASRRRSR
jgi:DHA2 family multidrug resistance protein-like MFS transporter